jgi:hypothetical protein
MISQSIRNSHQTRKARCGTILLIAVFMAAIGSGRASDSIELTVLGSWKRAPSPETGSSDAMAVQVAGTLAYIADQNHGLEIVDVSDPTKPDRVGGYPGHGWNLGVRGSFVYLSDLSAGVTVIDVTDPLVANAVGNYKSAGFPGGIDFEGPFACVAYGTNGLHILDVSDPANPKRVSTCAISGEAYDVAISENKAYVVDFSGSIVICDLASLPPRIPSSYKTGPLLTDVKVTNNVAYVAAGTSGLLILDVQNPSAPKPLGVWREDCIVQNLALAGNFLYLSGGRCASDIVESILRVIDVTDPSHPIRVGGLDGISGARGLAVVGDVLYVAAQHEGLKTIGISEIPIIRISAVEKDHVTLSWTRPLYGGVLQWTKSLNAPIWENVADSESTSTFSIAVVNAAAFYRVNR